MTVFSRELAKIHNVDAAIRKDVGELSGWPSLRQIGKTVDSRTDGA